MGNEYCVRNDEEPYIPIQKINLDDPEQIEETRLKLRKAADELPDLLEAVNRTQEITQTDLMAEINIICN